ncbi:hypothetical protein [Lewinella sp. IMCC34183]|uniref:hypothetical protein n=1 Tax=Lewinella sp. IMCC34183 TaxID=2248762 RepID=UPI0013006EE4|nr:hypothetical protein [Lewinella sp. IMCC34183]
MKDILDHKQVKPVDTGDIIKWWNIRRLQYNLIIASEFLIIYLLIGFSVTAYNIGYVLRFTAFTLLLANIFYFIGPGTQLLIRRMTKGKHTADSSTLVLYWAGVLLSIIIIGVCALKILHDIYRKELIESIT